MWCSIAPTGTQTSSASFRRCCKRLIEADEACPAEEVAYLCSALFHPVLQKQTGDAFMSEAGENAISASCLLLWVPTDVLPAMLSSSLQGLINYLQFRCCPAADYSAASHHAQMNHSCQGNSGRQVMLCAGSASSTADDRAAEGHGTEPISCALKPVGLDVPVSVASLLQRMRRLR